MKTKALIGLIGILSAGLSPLAWAEQSDSASHGGVSLGGAVSTDDRVSAKANPQLTFQAYRLELSADARPSDSARFHGEVWVRSAGLAPTELTGAQSAALYSLGGVVPVVVDLREAYFMLRGFVFENVDLKVGRQRIAWGTADKLNVTDNVNPLDLSDPWDFGRHLASDGVQLNVYVGGLQIAGVAVAQFTPAVLPAGDWSTALMPSTLEVPAGLTLGNVASTVTLPDHSLADSLTAGLRVKGNLFGWDLSASYLYGRQSLPVIDNIVITSAGLPVVNAELDLVYPREHVFGADLAGSLFGMGVWAEAAVFLPNETTLTTDSSAVGGGVIRSTALPGSPYVKYVVGGDYTFSGNIYLNGQFVHGLFQEAGEKELHDYVSVGLECRLFDEKLKLSPLSFIVEVRDWSNISDNYAVLAAPSVSIYPMDNVELVLGLHVIKATSSTVFAALSGQNEVFAHAKYSF